MAGSPSACAPVLQLDRPAQRRSRACSEVPGPRGAPLECHRGPDQVATCIELAWTPGEDGNGILGVGASKPYQGARRRRRFAQRLLSSALELRMFSMALSVRSRAAMATTSPFEVRPRAGLTLERVGEIRSCVEPHRRLDVAAELSWKNGGVSAASISDGVFIRPLP